ncbi:hypothetical protein ES703_96834 [subsurface metagenome]
MGLIQRQRHEQFFMDNGAFLDAEIAAQDLDIVPPRFISNPNPGHQVA